MTFLSFPPTNFNISILIISNIIKIMKKKTSIELASLAKQALKENTKRRPLRERDRVHETKVDIEDIEFILTFEYIPGEKETYEYPGSHDEIRLLSLEYKGVDFFDFIVEIHKNPKRFQEELEEEAMEYLASIPSDSDLYDYYKERDYRN